MRATLQIGALRGGGLVLGYRCSSRCRHCLYGCGPHRRDGAGDDDALDDALDGVLDALAQRAPGARYHIGGGEPFLDLPRLERAVRGMAARDLSLDYVETNASWARDRRHAEEVLGRLAAAGLPCALVSLSPFHAEHVPLARTLALIEAAEATLPGGAFVWIPELRADLHGQPVEARIDLDALIAARGGAAYARALAARYGLVPGGRAGRFLHDHGARHPWAAVAAEAPCAARLADTSHFHVDLDGRYVPGLCAGLCLPIDELPGAVDLARYPVLAALADGGPAALVELARTVGFAPDETYSAACDLCVHARCHLFASGQAYPELGPPGFYDRRSVEQMR